MISRVVAAVLDHPRATVGVWVAVLVAAALGLLQLRVDFSSAAFYGDDAEPIAELDAFR